MGFASLNPSYPTDATLPPSRALAPCKFHFEVRLAFAGDNPEIAVAAERGAELHLDFVRPVCICPTDASSAATRLAREPSACLNFSALALAISSATPTSDRPIFGSRPKWILAPSASSTIICADIYFPRPNDRTSASLHLFDESAAAFYRVRCAGRRRLCRDIRHVWRMATGAERLRRAGR